jgi:thioredoxin reductase (NADPH)
MGRVAAYGRVPPIHTGEVLVEQDAKDAPFFVVKSGEIQMVCPALGTESQIIAHGPGEFTGEINMIIGRRSALMVGFRASQPGEVIELDRDQLMSLIQMDAELSNILLRAFILKSRTARPRSKRPAAARIRSFRRHTPCESWAPADPQRSAPQKKKDGDS